MLGRRDSPSKHTVRIPIATTLKQLFVVFFAPSTEMPKFQELKARVDGALGNFLGEPLLTRAREYSGQHLQLDLAKRIDLPPVPVPLLRHTGLDELEERKLEASTLAILIQADDDTRLPHVGLWTAFAAACASAEVLGGTIFDPAASRVVQLARLQRPLSQDGRIAVAKHVVVPFSIGEQGLGWMTTTGMVKFGLPDLEIVDIPPGLSDLARLMNATAQYLVGALDGRPEQDSRGSELELPAEPRVTFGDHEAANGRSGDGSRAARVAIRMTEGSPGQQSFLRLIKPADLKASHGEWLYQALNQLFGSQRDVRNVRTSSPAMQEAHRRAIAELGTAKTRFARGLRPGETLYVKHGFDAGARGKEYMWVVVNRWSGTRLEGQLTNDARDSGLKAGHDVSIDESEVFDWMIQLPHGEHEGGHTSDIALTQGLKDGLSG